MDQSKLKLTMQLVADHGLYMITNAVLGEGNTPLNTGMIVFAKGCNPDIDDDFYDEKCRIFGDDDGSVDIPLSWLELAAKKGKRSFSINLGKTQVKLKL